MRLKRQARYAIMAIGADSVAVLEGLFAVLLGLFCTAVGVLWQCCLNFFALQMGLFFIAVGIRNGQIECELRPAMAVYGDGVARHVAVGWEWLM